MTKHSYNAVMLKKCASLHAPSLIGSQESSKKQEWIQKV